LQISTGFASWQRYCTASSSGCQPNFAALNRGRHVYSAGRPSRWALAHISSIYFLLSIIWFSINCWTDNKFFRSYVYLSCIASELSHVSFRALLIVIVIMVALWNRADHYIFDAVVCYFFFFFPRLNSQPPQIGCLSYLHTWCGLSANLRSRSETCCTRLAEKNRTQKCRQKSPSGHYRTSLSGYIFATEARIDNRKKTC